MANDSDLFALTEDINSKHVPRWELVLEEKFNDGRFGEMIGLVRRLLETVAINATLSAPADVQTLLDMLQRLTFELERARAFIMYFQHEHRGCLVDDSELDRLLAAYDATKSG